MHANTASLQLLLKSLSATHFIYQKSTLCLRLGRSLSISSNALIGVNKARCKIVTEICPISEQ